ncbi:hypothetical protein SCHPADRAFT_75928 [Schizopora paradoxa]|uniref:DUF6533 domain-containing protein n=1 Tax=Schizopora paradoxa TaxID=27342 RepID=A0A0H2S685_9AGAM|nr:hypothetical protein SCHPADRAFT_75928 [Schizopora paradoxa]
MATTISLPAPILSQLNDAMLVKYANFISVSILVYDVLITMPDEIRLIWPWEWRVGKVLYLITRYSAFIDNIIFQVFWFNKHMSAESCRTLFSTGSWFLFFGIVIAQWIICMRTYALWGQKRSILVLLIVLCLATEITSIILMHKFLHDMIWTISPFPTVTRCFVVIPSNKLYIDYGLIMIVELTIISLTVWKGFSQWKMRGNSTLLTTLYRDGALFFAFLFAISMGNFLLYMITPRAMLEFLLPEPQRTLHSVLTARIILHLRGAAVTTSGGNTKVLSSLHAYRPSTNKGLSSEDTYDSELTVMSRSVGSMHTGQTTLVRVPV